MVVQAREISLRWYVPVEVSLVVLGVVVTVYFHKNPEAGSRLVA